MALMLAPYNDSMRLGMGFNSYTQTLCIDRAVKYNAHKVKTTANVSQTVTYSSKLVQHLSEIASSLNVSHSASIKKGTVEVAGNSNAINEEKVKQSDINAVVTVNVVNQTRTIEDDSEFNQLEGLSLSAFNETYGDCYISGFIEGGNFNGVISMRVLDRSKKESFINSMKKSTSSGTKRDFSLDMDSLASAMDNSNASNETETTVSVSWMGGGQVKDSDAPWDLTSVTGAAARFPDLVAQCPQRTWAILTKYKANRSFVEKTIESQLSPLQYDLVASYTSELFDSYMAYKQLINYIQQVILKPANYMKSYAAHAIPTKLTSLIATRTALRTEMAKIVKAVDIIAKNPDVLETNKSLNAEPSDEEVRGFIDSILHPNGAEKSLPQAATAVKVLEQPVVPDGAENSPPQTTNAAKVLEQPAVLENEGEPPAPEFDFKAMIAPELWEEVLPILEGGEERTSGASASDMPKSLADFFGPPPANDLEDLARHSKTQASIPCVRVLRAVLGFNDVTDSVRGWERAPGVPFTFTRGDIKTIASQDMNSWDYSMFERGKPPIVVFAVLYRFSDEDTTLRLFTTEYSAGEQVKDLNENFTIQRLPNGSSIGTVLGVNVMPPSPAEQGDQSDSTKMPGPLAVLDGAAVILNSKLFASVVQQLASSASVDSEITLSKDDPGMGDLLQGYTKPFYIFYRWKAGGEISCAVGIPSVARAVIPRRQIRLVPQHRTRILRAMLGLNDVTEYLTSMIGVDGLLRFTERGIVDYGYQNLAWPHVIYGMSKTDHAHVLVIAYQLDGSPTTIRTFRFPDPSASQPANPQTIQVLDSTQSGTSLDDGVFMPNDPTAIVYSWQVMTPTSSPELANALKDKCGNYKEGGIALTHPEMVKSLPGDPDPGLHKTYHIFYRMSERMDLYCASGVEGRLNAFVHPY